MEFEKEADRIYKEDDTGKLIAEITFPETEPGVFCIDHTFVDESLRGQGVAQLLMTQAVEEIKSKGGIIEATCSFAKHWLEKNYLR